MIQRKKWAAALGSGALAAMLLGSALAAPAALATDIGETIPASVTTGSLTIHKYETPTDGSTILNDGTDHTADAIAHDWTPIEGVTFTIYPVLQGGTAIDLHTNAGLLAANTASVGFNTDGDLPSGFSRGTGIPGTTNDLGQAVFGNLPIGVYVVEETGSPTLTGGQALTPAAPFIVTVPITNTLNHWETDVHVYPKNSISSATKTVADGSTTDLDETETWTIQGDIKSAPVDLDGDGNISGLNEENNISGYDVVDNLPAQLLYTAGTTTVKIVKPDGTVVATLASDTDYSLTEPTSGTPGGTLLVVIKGASSGATASAGIAQLEANANLGYKLQVQFNTTRAASGEIENTAEVWPNNGRTTWQSGQPGGPVTTPPASEKFGGIKVLKTDNTSSPAKNLGGAVFEVYANLSAAEAAAQPLPAAKKVEINGVSQWESGTDGVVTIDGLRYSAWANGDQVPDANRDGTIDQLDPGYIEYFLVEVKAPAGYSLLANPVSFEVSDQAANTTASNFTIKNVPLNAGFNLPLTGGTGSTAVLIAGGVLIVGGIAFLVVLMVRRRREQQHGEVAGALR